MKKIFLISSSRYKGGEFWAHCIDALAKFLDKPEVGRNKILFVPYANVDGDYDGYTKIISDTISPFGYEVIGIHKYQAADIHDVLKDKSITAICIGGGNTWELNYFLQEKLPVGFLRAVKDKVDSGKWKYIGASAGTVTACPTFLTTNDMPTIIPKSELALNIVPFQINAHFIPGSILPMHMGEPREERIRQVLVRNPEWKVVGLPEGCWIEVEGNEHILRGVYNATIFRKEDNNLIWLPNTSI